MLQTYEIIDKYQLQKTCLVYASSNYAQGKKQSVYLLAQKPEVQQPKLISPSPGNSRSRYIFWGLALAQSNRDNILGGCLRD